MVVGDTIHHGLSASRSSAGGGGNGGRDNRDGRRDGGRASSGRRGGLSDGVSTSGDAGPVPTLDPLH